MPEPICQDWRLYFSKVGYMAGEPIEIWYCIVDEYYSYWKAYYPQSNYITQPVKLSNDLRFVNGYDLMMCVLNSAE